MDGLDRGVFEDLMARGKEKGGGVFSVRAAGGG